MSRIKQLSEKHANYDISVDIMAGFRAGEVATKAIVQAFDKETGKLIRKAQGMASGPAEDFDKTQNSAIDKAIDRILGTK